MNAPFVPPRPTPPAREPGLLAYLAAVRSNALGMWSEAAYEQEVGHGRMLGRPILLLNAPEAIRRVLVDNPGNYRRTAASLRILRPVAGDGLLLSEGERWRVQRRAVAPTLAPRTMKLLVPHMAAATASWVARLRGMAAQGPVDLLAAMQALTLEAAGRAMFSLEVAQFGAPVRRLLTEYALRLGRPYTLDMLLPAWLPSPHDLSRWRFRRRWTGLMDSMLAARIAAPPAAAAPRDLFDVLLAARDPETGATFSPAELRDQVTTLLIAGHETTALTLFWALLLLALAPAEQARVAAEVAGADLAPAAAGEALGRLPYTRAVVDETLRLYPPAFTLARQAIGADRAGDTAIAPGAVLLIAPWVLHRHRRLWQDPDIFLPARFLPGAAPPGRYAYMPFGAGPRVCVGAQFALTEATLVLASVIQAFRVSLGSTRPVMPAPVITTQPDHAPAFLLTPR